MKQLDQKSSISIGLALVIFAAIVGAVVKVQVTLAEIQRDVAHTRTDVAKINKRTALGDARLQNVETKVAVIRTEIEQLKKE